MLCVHGLADLGDSDRDSFWLVCECGTACPAWYRRSTSWSECSVSVTVEHFN